MPLKNIIKVAAAGAGKTYSICGDALKETNSETPNKKALILSYTNKGIDSIKQEIKNQNSGVLSSQIHVMTWYRFLLNEMVKPYQTELFNINELKSIDFSKSHGFKNFANQGTRERYITNEKNLYPKEIGELAIRLNDMSGGKVVNRLKSIYSHIFVDEIQDMAGYDLNIIELLIGSDVVITCVGDNKQATFKTNTSNKNKNKSGVNVWDFFSDLISSGEVELVESLDSRRFNKDICEFANIVYPNEKNMDTTMNKKTEHDGVFLIKKCDVEKYYNYYNPTVLKYDKRTDVGNYSSYNYGACKGMTFERVLIYPNNPYREFLFKQKMLSSPQKYYVAATRARYSMAFVVDVFPNNSEIFQNETITIGDEEISVMRFVYN